MPEFKVDVVKIDNVSLAPNADKLDLINVYGGYPCLVPKGQFKVGDLAAYIVVDSLVPASRPEFAHLQTSRMKEMAEKGELTEENSKHRVKAIRLRGTFSMGLLVKVSDPFKEGDDAAQHFGVTKYEEPENKNEKGSSSAVFASTEFEDGPNIPVYDLEHLRKHYAQMKQKMDEDIEAGGSGFVTISEKLHGSNAAFVWTNDRLYAKSRTKFRRNPNPPYKELKIKVADMVRFGFKVGRKLISGFDKIPQVKKLKKWSWLSLSIDKSSPDMWWEVAEKYNLAEKLKNYPDVAIYGEIYGDGVQDLKYGLKGERKFIAFDAVKVKTKEFLNHDTFLYLCEKLDIPTVPVFYEGLLPSFEELEKMAEIKSSVVCPNQIGEGIVVKSKFEDWHPKCGRLALKLVGQTYLLRKGGTEYH